VKRCPLFRDAGEISEMLRNRFMTERTAKNLSEGGKLVGS
jgi:hypothetical protein